MKRYVILLGIIAGAAVIAGSAYIANRYLSRSNAERPAIVTCSTVHKKYSVSIHDGMVLPVRTQAALCDELTIVNEDDQLRLVAFGPHDNHQPYDGVGEKVLAQGQSLTVILNQAGTYEFHDHLQDMVIGYFTVASD